MDAWKAATYQTWLSQTRFGHGRLPQAHRRPHDRHDTLGDAELKKKKTLSGHHRTVDCVSCTRAATKSRHHLTALAPRRYLAPQSQQVPNNDCRVQSRQCSCLGARGHTRGSSELHRGPHAELQPSCISHHDTSYQGYHGPHVVATQSRVGSANSTDRAIMHHPGFLCLFSVRGVFVLTRIWFLYCVVGKLGATGPRPAKFYALKVRDSGD